MERDAISRTRAGKRGDFPSGFRLYCAIDRSMRVGGKETSVAERLAIRCILGEHRSIALALDAIGRAIVPTGADSVFDLDAVSAMLAYLEAFPERAHHPKEETYLFDALAARSLEAQPLLSTLRDEHVQGLGFIVALQRNADELRGATNGDVGPLRQAFGDYDAFYRAHMRLEEEALLPLAQRALVDADWRRIDTAFATNLDPLGSAASSRDFEAILKQALARLRPMR
jgi:hemerythrin-like domain-containing protein